MYPEEGHKMYLGYSPEFGKSEEDRFDRLRGAIQQMDDGPDKRSLERRIAKIDKAEANLRHAQEKAARDAFIISPCEEKAMRRRAIRIGVAPLCSYCSQLSDEMESDHIVAKALGGDNGRHNRTPACRQCNSRKGDKPFLRWLMEIGGGQDAS